MYNVLIVDDEPWMLEGLRTMIDWRSAGFEVCAEATDGEDALELIKTRRPDVVVTDIRMPIIDGLELLRLSRNSQQTQAKFIILSGYGQFDYARTALSHQASTYLLKPIDPEQFHPVLQQLKRELDEERSKQMEQESERAALVKQLLSGSSQHDEQQAMLNRIQALLEIDDRTSLRCAIVQHHAVDVPKLKQEIMEQDAFSSRYSLFQIGPHQIGVLMIAEGPDLLAALQAFHNKLSERYGADWCFFVSESAQGVGALKKLYHQALKARNDCQLSALDQEGIHLYDPAADEVFNYDWYEGGETLLGFIQNNDTEAIQRSVQEAFQHFRSSKAAPSIVQSFVSNLVVEIVNITGNSLFHSLSRFKTGRSTLEQKVIDYCIDAAEQLALARGHGSPVADAIAYAKKNYDTRIKLNEVAEQLHIQPAYLGQQFKKTTGVSFNDYVHTMRIEEAKKLLRRTDMKISDIARSVGYKDAEDFVKKFKACTGVLPSAYKNR